jgi:hypothetical protein
MNIGLTAWRVLRAACLLWIGSLPVQAHTAPAKPAMTPNPLLADPRPWCIGRFVLDRPAQSELYYEKYEYWGIKIDVTHDVSAETFQHKVNTRENELRTKKRTDSISYKDMLARGLKSMVFETDAPWLEQAVSPTPHSRLLFFGKTVRPDDLLTEEGYVLAGSTMLVMNSLIRPGDIQRSIGLTTDVYQNITYRDNWTVPTERGFCIDGALIGGPSRNSEVTEQTIILQRLGRLSLFVIKMRDAVDVDQQYPLLKNLSDLRRTLRAQGYGGVRVLRKGKRQVAGMDAEEVLFSIKKGKTQLFRFYLLAPGVYHSAAQPHTDIRLMLGDTLTAADKADGVTPEEASSPVDEDGAIQVWDTMLDSMRLRPGAL